MVVRISLKILCALAALLVAGMGMAQAQGPGDTVSSLMKTSLDPAAQKLWKAVSYVATEQGVTETAPSTDADWQLLREQADQLMKAAAVLMLPIVKIAASPSTERPAFQYQPHEIEELRRQKLREWRDYVQQLQLSTQNLAGAIDKKDPEQLQELGVPVYRACEGCHARFWYKPVE